MKKLLATRNRKKSTEQGFSIAVSTGFGLVIMMIGLTLMGRAMKDSSVSASQKVVTQSDAAAQTGIARYTAFLSKYPQLAEFPPSQWIAKAPGNAEVATYANRLDTWQNITASGDNGQYKFVDYVPAPVIPGLPPTTGTFVIEGRVGQTSTGTGDDLGTGKAIASIETTVDVTPVVTPTATPTTTPTATPTVAVTPTPTSQNVLFPALWLRQGPGSTASSADSANGHYFSANGLLEDTSTDELYAKIGATKEDKGPLSPRTTLRIADFLPAKPTSNLNSLNNVSKALSLPKDSDTFTTETINGVSTKVYRYSVNSITLKGKDSVTVNTVNSSGSGNATPQKILFYLDGSIIPTTAQTRITNVCKNRDGSSATNCDLTSFIIYGYGQKTATNTPKICSGNGTNRIDGFIIAPEYVVGHGSGSGNGQGGFKGAVWANNWSKSNSDCGQDNGNQMTVEQMNTTNYTWSDVANWTTAAPTNNSLFFTKQIAGASIVTDADGVKRLVK